MVTPWSPLAVILPELDLDPDAALQLAVALGRFRRDVEEPRPALAELERFARVAMHGTEADSPRSDREDIPVPAFMTRRDFAARVGRNERTIRRWIERGDLVATVAGIPSTELDRLRGRTPYAPNR